MFITTFMHSAKMMSTNKRTTDISALLCKLPDTRVSQLIPASSLHCNSQSVIFSLCPENWNMLLPSWLLDSNSTGPGWALLCTAVYLLEWGALVSFTQRMVWPLRLINDLCWLKHSVNEVSRSAAGSRSCLSVLAPDTDSLVNFSSLTSLHCSGSLYKLWIVLFINLHKRLWDTGIKCRLLIRVCY